MRRLNLTTVLVAFNLAVVAVAITGVGWAGVNALRRMSREQAVARVRQAGAQAQSWVAGEGAQLVRTAELLAAQPGFVRQVRAGQADSLQQRLRETSASQQLDGCLVLAGGATLVAVGAAALPDETELHRGGPRWFLEAPRGSPAVHLSVLAPVPGVPRAQLLLVRFLQGETVAQLGERLGLAAAVLTRQTAQSRGSDPSVGLRMSVLESGVLAAAHLDVLERTVAVAPLNGPDGEIVGLCEVSEASAGAGPGLTRLIGSLLVLVIAMGALATLFSLLLARNIGRPVEDLTAAALRIGRGDFSTPVPHRPGSGVEALAGAMEEMRDRTQRLTGELRRRQAEAEAVLAGISEGVFAVGRARRIRYLNAQAAALLGIAPEAAVGRFCGDVLNPQGPGGVRPCEENCPILHARFRGSAQATEHLLLADGRRRTVLIASSPSGPPGPDGVPQQFQVIRDETELEASRRLRDAVLANISHEFRTPLSAQLASLELLRDRLPELSVEELGGLIQAIERGSLRLTHLVDNLLESTRIEAGQDSIRRRPVALDEVIEEAVALTAPLIEQRHQILQVALPFPLPGVSGDGPRLVQVFVNLLANANKFAPERSLICVGGAVGEREIQLWVEDQGPGLPEGAGEMIFQRFTRALGEEPEESGMGLGLFIVKSIVDRHGGRVEARSSSTGTRVIIAFPRPAPSAAGAPPGQAAPSGAAGPARPEGA